MIAAKTEKQDNTQNVNNGGYQNYARHYLIAFINIYLILSF